MRGTGGWDEGVVGGMVCGGGTGAGGFPSAEVFAAAGRTGFGSTGAGGIGSFCEGGPAGVTDAGVGTRAAGACGICGGGSGLFSGTGNDIGTGSLTGTGESTRGAGACVSFIAGVAGAAG